MGGLADSVGTIAVNITGDYSELQTAINEASSTAERGASQIADSFSSHGHELEAASHGTEDAFDGISEKLVEMGAEFGLTIGAAELLKETFEAFSTLQDATSALTALTGSAEQATAQIDALREMAQDQNLALPQLLEANQRLNAFGFAVEDIPGALQAAADAAVAMHKGVDDAANAIERMAASGMAGGRQLSQLGLTSTDLAAAMGVTEDAAKKMFQALDQDTRLEVLTVALDKFRGQSEATASDLSRQWQGVKTAFEELLAGIGKMLAPFASGMLQVFRAIIQGWENLVAAIRVGGQAIEAIWIRITQGQEAMRQKIAEFAAEEAKANEEHEKSAHTAEDHAKKIEELKKQIADAVKHVHLQSDEMRDAHKPLQDLTSDIAVLTDQLNSYLKAQRAVSQEVANYKTEQEALGRSLTVQQAAAEMFFNAFLKGADGIEAIRNSTPPVIDDLGNLSETGERAAKSWQELTHSTQEFNKSLTGMLGQIKPPADAAMEAVSRLDKAFASGNLAQAQHIINQIAVDDLPTAVKYQDELVQKMEAAGASQEKLNAAIKMQAQLHEQLAVIQNQGITQYMTRLALVDLATKNVGYTTRQVFGTVITQAIHGMDQVLGQVGNSFAKLIVEGGSFGRMMHQLFSQIAQTILSTLINALVKMGEQFLIEKLLESTASQVTAIAAVTNAAGVAYANAFAATAAIPIVGPALAPEVAGAAMAATLAGGLPLASAAQGAVLDKDTFVQAHAEEMILPASLSNGLQDLIQNNKTAGTVGNGVTIAIQNMHGVTRDTADAIAEKIVRKARLAGAFR